MTASLTLFLAAIVFGFGFGIGQSLWAGLIGLLKR